MIKSWCLLFLILMIWPLQGQEIGGRPLYPIKGKVRGKETRTPISGIRISTDTGIFTQTDGLGEFRLRTYLGDVLTFEGPEMETVSHTIRNTDEIIVEVEGYRKRQSSQQVNPSEVHQQMLDSAVLYKSSDLEKSLGFIASSIDALGTDSDKALLARSLTLLGEVYMEHGQYDLALSNLLDAQKHHKTIRSTIALSQAQILLRDYSAAYDGLLSIKNEKNLPVVQRALIFEGLGDAQKGMGRANEAIEDYEVALTIAQKNNLAVKEIDLHSKIAETYADLDKQIEAQGYYDRSLKLSKVQPPQKAIEENEKVADFYSRTNRYQDEIQLRKKSLEEIGKIGSANAASGASARLADSISAQRINYKIANAYIAQDKPERAIPYLERSIIEADGQQDLVVKKEATKALSEVFENQGELAKAYSTYREYVTLVDSLYSTKERELNHLARVNQEITEKQNRIASLEQDRELSESKYSLALAEQQLGKEKNKRQQWLIYSLGLGLLAFALAAFVFYRSDQKQKMANNALALRSLRTQMNPHFIFNALNAVNHYIAKNDERSANRYLSEFSTLMRTVLDNSDQDFIPLSKEVALLRLYLKLEHARFPDKFDYGFDVDSAIDLEAFQIPPMLVQPYVENAIWHGLRYKEDKGQLVLKLTGQNENEIKIELTDDGIGRKRSAELKTQNQKKQKSKGMGNIKKRMEVINKLYGDPLDVWVSDLNDDGSGTKVVILLRQPKESKLWA